MALPLLNDKFPQRKLTDKEKDRERTAERGAERNDSPVQSSAFGSFSAVDAQPTPTRARSKDWLELRRREHGEVCAALQLYEATNKISWDILYRTYQRGIADEVRPAGCLGSRWRLARRSRRARPAADPDG